MDDLEKLFNEEVDKIKKDPQIVVKWGMQAVVGYCTGAIFTIALNTLVPKDMLTRKQKIQLSVAAWAMGGAVTDRASRWASNSSLTGNILCKIADNFKQEEKPEEEEDHSRTED